MCGIFASIKVNNILQPLNKASNNGLEYKSEILEANSRRGPDYQSSYKLDVESLINQNGLTNKTIVEVEIQGFVLHLRGDQVTSQPIIKNGDVLCWNGEIFGGLDVNIHQNDTSVLMDTLEECQSEVDILNVFNKLLGPHAFVYYKKNLNTLYFGRDKLGIRSLLKKEFIDNSSTQFYLSSVTSKYHFDKIKEDKIDYKWEELNTQAIFKLDFEKGFKCKENGEIYIQEGIECIYRVEKGSEIPTYLSINTEIPLEEEIHLPSDINEDAYLSYLNTLPNYSRLLDQFEEQLKSSIETRVVNIPPKSEQGYSKVAILFSGGIDCTMIAYYVNQFLPLDESIDLFNVAFENLRTIKANKNDTYSVPDRKTGQASVEELRILCPGRQFNFVQIDIPYNEVQRHSHRIQSLIAPSDTVMDLSIALAFWFASRGEGYIIKDNVKVPYQSKAKVLLSGLGADEQLGGYSRHRSAFERGSWEGLIQEVQLDVSRIHTRNLGRDDRVCSDWGKEVRYPYLATPMLNFLNSLSIHWKTNPTFQRGIGDKTLLRALAKRVGFCKLPTYAKRAVQFGARTAKMLPEESSSKGHMKL